SVQVCCERDAPAGRKTVLDVPPWKTLKLAGKGFLLSPRSVYRQFGRFSRVSHGVFGSLGGSFTRDERLGPLRGSSRPGIAPGLLSLTVFP
ncbi:MAG: hypothetical protein OWU33_16670, partial [Firmicutes bacterium]|nr:hypothetical protein [Bacillota bacterium]